MIVTVPIQVWLQKRGEESGLDKKKLLEHLKQRDKYHDKPLFRKDKHICLVMVSCNKAAAIAWIAAKLQFKMDARRCGCGNYGYRKDNDHTYVCALCEVRESVYRRSMDAFAERLQSRRNEEIMFFDNTVDVVPELSDAVLA